MEMNPVMRIIHARSLSVGTEGRTGLGSLLRDAIGLCCRHGCCLVPGREFFRHGGVNTAMKYWTKEWYRDPSLMTTEPDDPAGFLARLLLPDLFAEDFLMNGAVVTEFLPENGNLRIVLDAARAYTPISEIFLTDCEILVRESADYAGLIWKYDEIYYEDGRFVLHILFADETDGLFYLTVAFSKICVSREAVRREEDRNLLDMVDMSDQGKYLPKSKRRSEQLEEVLFWKKN